MTRIEQMRIIITLLFLALPIVCARADERPNIVVIMVDDMGWSDLGCFGGEVETPNIDAMAKRGVMFWQAYSPAPTCAPTRCAIMSGNHPARAQKTHVVGGAPPAPYNRTAHRMMPAW